MSLRSILRAAADSGRRTTFLAADGQTATHRGWDSLLSAGRQRAANLSRCGVAPKERVLIVGETSPQLVESIIAVHLRGATPVLLAPPIASRKGHTELVARIVQATDAACVLATEASATRVARVAQGKLHVIEPEPVAEPLVADEPEAETAFLQFSSGSTRTPRGVRVLQSSLAANLADIGETAKIRDDDKVVSWLPLYHDMGLVAGLLGPPAWGVDGVLMDPLTFIHRPVRWLAAISDHRGTISMAPNFAFEYCLRFVREGDLRDLDLSSWRIAWNGAEMVLPSTVERFNARYEVAGLDPKVIVPCYGAAEATLKVTSHEPGQPLSRFALSRAALAQSKAVRAVDGEPAREVLGVGSPGPGTTLRILDDDGQPLDDGCIGEIEVRGPGVSPGYAVGSAEGLDGQCWRSGDLGFVEDGQLFITGRKRDLIIVDGRNLFPFDLEDAARDFAPKSVRRVAAFAELDERAGTERAVIALELPGHKTLDSAAIAAIKQAVCDVAATAKVRIVKLKRIPATTSGKTQRALAQALHLAGESEPLG